MAVVAGIGSARSHFYFSYSAFVFVRYFYRDLKNDGAFVSIADDDPIIRKWADDYDLKGQKYFWPDPDTREIMKNWHIFWSPYYLLIDKEGVIVDYGAHILPRMNRTREKIDCLLEE